MSALVRTRRALRAIVLWYVWRVLTAWIVVSPLARALTSPVASRHPRGDAVLFDPGGLELVESLRLSLGVLGSELKGSFLVATLLGALSLIPAGALLTALTEETRTGPAAWLARAFGLMPRFLLSFGTRVFLQGALLGLGGWGALRASRRLAASLPERTADLYALAVLAVVLVLVLAVGVFEDVLRAELLRGGSLKAAFWRAARLLRARGPSLAGAWLVLGACSLALPLAAAPLAGALELSRPESWRLLVVALLHQGVLFALVALRGLWLAVVVDAGSAPGAEGLPVDLQGAPSGPIPTEIEPHHAPAEPGE